MSREDLVLATFTRARRRAGLSQEAFANVVGTTQSAISEAERGVTPPNLRTLQRWASMLGLRVALLPAYPVDPMPYVSGDLGDR